ncbi:MAG: hypothetical protein LLF84_00220, partial [Methanoregulaceae archaeon]|nr:hypothetical protein [Methanoregulaceae archaeon]
MVVYPKRRSLVAIALCLILIAIAGGAASGIAGSLTSLPGYDKAVAAANKTVPGTPPPGSLRSLPGYQEALSQAKGASNGDHGRAAYFQATLEANGYIVSSGQ